MRTKMFVPLITLGAILASGVASAADPAVLREYRLVDTAGEEFTLADLEGQVVVVNFWATWCRPCLKELPTLNQWSGQMEDVKFVAISVDQDRQKAMKLAGKSADKMTVCLDGADGLARKLDLDFLPCTFVLDPKGEIALTTPGVTDELMAQMRTVITSLQSRVSSPSMEVGR